MLDYGLIQTLYSHTTHKSNVQWISIWFVWLYVFKCDICMLNSLLIKPKNIFECFICFWKWFLSFLFWKFSSKCQNFCVEKLGVWQFCDSLRKWMQSHPSREVIWGNLNFFTNSSREFRNSFMSALQLRPDPQNLALCICTFRE